jgi:Holliday junction resolvase RusA-like endonuclease
MRRRETVVTVLVEFEVLGTPMSQGSKKAFVANGRAMMKESSGGHAAWRNAVARAAKDIVDTAIAEWAEMEGGLNFGYPLDGPLGLSVEFRFPMPKSRPKTDRHRGRIFKTTAPDTSKLIRCIEDGLQAGGLIVDDARFCAIEACKVEVVGWIGATITITREDHP